MYELISSNLIRNDDDIYVPSLIYDRNQNRYLNFEETLIFQKKNNSAHKYLYEKSDYMLDNNFPRAIEHAA